MKTTNYLIRQRVLIAIVSLLAAIPLLSDMGPSNQALASGQSRDTTAPDHFLAPPLESVLKTRNAYSEWVQGGTWSPLGGGANLDVNAIAVSGSNVYAGGAFSHAGGILVNKIARWDGSAWSALGSGTNNSVLAIALMGNDVYAAGSFTFAGGSSANRVARWDGSSWSPLGSGVNATIYSMAISGSDVYVGGQFTTAGGVPANYIAKWNGSTWSALGSGTNGLIYSMAISGSDVYVGGQFTTAGGVAARNIAKWNGSTWSALGAAMGPDAPVEAIAVSGSDLYVGGQFTTAGGVPANRIAKWNGSSWSALGSGLNYAVYDVAVNGTDVYVGGRFTTAGGVPASRVAGWNGSDWFDLAGGVNDATNNAYVYAMTMGSGGVYVGGTFTTAGGGGVPASRIAFYQTTGLPTITPGPTLTPTNTPIPTSTRTSTPVSTPTRTPTRTPTPTFTPVPGDNPPILIVPLNRPYRIGVEVGNYLALRFDAHDPDVGDTVTLSVSGLPSGANFPIPAPGNPIYSTFTWRPTTPDIGNYFMTVIATDSFGAQDVETIEIEVVPGCVPYFSDVFTADYYYSGVQYLFCQLIISGYIEADQTFAYRPYNNTTRGQFSKMIVGAYNIPPYNPPTPDFIDVPPTDVFYPYVEAAFRAGIIGGYADRTFRPYASITRGQLSKLIVGAARWPVDTSGGPHFSDVAPGSTFYDVIETAYNHGVISGYACGGPGEPCDAQNRAYFRVGNSATRGQIAKIIHLALGSPTPR